MVFTGLIESFIQRYKNEKANIEEPALLIRINRLFHYGITSSELYDATRGVWVLGENREKAKYASAVYDRVIQEVYIIISWHKAGETFSTRGDTTLEGRWEFIGNIAQSVIRDKYINRSVAHYFKPGSQSPVIYVNI